MPSPKGPLMTEPAFVLPLRYSFEFPVPEIQRRDYSFQEVNVLSLETIPERGQNACLLNASMLNLRNHHLGASLSSGPETEELLLIPQLFAGSI